MSSTPRTQGKGSARRRQLISDDEMAANWERIFSKGRDSAGRAPESIDERTDAVPVDESDSLREQD